MPCFQGAFQQSADRANTRLHVAALDDMEEIAVLDYFLRTIWQERTF